METRSGTILCSSEMPKPQKARLSNRKRGSSSICPSYDTGKPVRKKLKSTKTVRFEDGVSCAKKETRPRTYTTSTSGPFKWHQDLLNSPHVEPLTKLSDEDAEWLADLDEVEAFEPEEVEEPKIPKASNSHRKKKHQDMLGTLAGSTANASDSQIESDSNFGQRYRTLKQLAWRWAKSYFCTKGCSAQKPVDLLKLCKDSPKLMEFANYISACADEPWEYVFNERRHFLVFGILGKMLEVHVFGHEMFGATEEQLKELRETDGQLSMEDGMCLLLSGFLLIRMHAVDRGSTDIVAKGCFVKRNASIKPALFSAIRPRTRLALLRLCHRISSPTSPLCKPPSCTCSRPFSLRLLNQQILAIPSLKSYPTQPPFLSAPAARRTYFIISTHTPRHWLALLFTGHAHIRSCRRC